LPGAREELNAETPGQFHVLPANGYAMHAPGIRTLSDEFQLRIQHSGDATVAGEPRR
jgi:hypothetical protein